MLAAGSSRGQIAGRTARSSKCRVVARQRELDRLLDARPVPRDLLQPLVHRCIEVLLSTVVTHPGWHAIDIRRLALELNLARIVRRRTLPLQNSHSSLSVIAVVSYSSSAYAVMISNTPDDRNRHTTQARRPSVELPATS